jgi:hypothetical protein
MRPLNRAKVPASTAGPGGTSDNSPPVQPENQSCAGGTTETLGKFQPSLAGLVPQMDISNQR